MFVLRRWAFVCTICTGVKGAQSLRNLLCCHRNRRDRVYQNLHEHPLTKPVPRRVQAINIWLVCDIIGKVLFFIKFSSWHYLSVMFSTGYTGWNCESVVQDGCLSSPCYNNGTCVPIGTTGNYTCDCVQGTSVIVIEMIVFHSISLYFVWACWKYYDNVELSSCILEFGTSYTNNTGLEIINQTPFLTLLSRPLSTCEEYCTQRGSCNVFIGVLKDDINDIYDCFLYSDSSYDSAADLQSTIFTKSISYTSG